MSGAYRDELEAARAQKEALEEEVEELRERLEEAEARQTELDEARRTAKDAKAEAKAAKKAAKAARKEAEQAREEAKVRVRIATGREDAAVVAESSALDPDELTERERALARLDRDWELEQKTYMLFESNGAGFLPKRGMISALWLAGIIVAFVGLWMFVGANEAVHGVLAFGPLLLVVGAVVGVWYSVQEIRKRLDGFERAKREYDQVRGKLVAEINALQREYRRRR